MNKPTVTVTPDDGSGRNVMSWDHGGDLKHRIQINKRNNSDDTIFSALYHAIERIAELEAERDAMAAHVEQLTLVFLQGFESSEDHDLDAWEDDAKAVLARQPSTSLAQRDARMKAEALEEVIRRIELHQRLYREQMVCGDPSKGLDKAAYVAGVMLDEYRQQAEGNNNEE